MEYVKGNTKSMFLAHLVPGSRPEILSERDASWLRTTPDLTPPERPEDRSPSFVFVNGPNSLTTTSADGRYLIAIQGNFELPCEHDSRAEWLEKAVMDRQARVVDEINGNWRFLLIDIHRERATAATDRMGSQRICFAHDAGGAITMAHDSEAVTSVHQSPFSIRPDSLLLYFYFHCIPSPSTLFEEIQSLGPATTLTWQAGGAEIERYWRPRFADRRSDSDNLRPEQLLATLEDAVSSACVADRTAAFLSGGLDSSTVVGLASKHTRCAVTPFTIGFDVPEYDETRYANIAAHHFGTETVRYEVTPGDVIDAMSTVAEVYDEPFGNSSTIPTYYCALAAVNAGESTILAGDGGDELFAGNERYRTQQIFSYYEKLPGMLRRYLMEPVFLQAFSATNFLPVRKARRYIEQAKLPMPDRLQTYNFLHVHGVSNIFTPRFLEAVDTNSPTDHLRSVYSETDTDCLVDRMLYLDWKLTLADNDLRKVTTMCERAGINVTFPMLDNRLLELSCRIPGTRKMQGGKLRDFFKKSVDSLLPAQIINKPKHGFGLPFGPWFANSTALRDHALGFLDGLSQRGIIRADYIDLIRRATIGEHPGYYGEMIWLMCVLESWLTTRPRWRDYKI